MTSRPLQQFIKGQTILQEGSPGDRSYRILSGEVLVCRRNQLESLIPIAKLGIGEIFGEMYLFEENSTRTATVIAASGEVLVETYFREDLQSMLNTLSQSTHDIFSGLSLRLRKTSGKYVEQVTAKQIAELPDGTVKPAAQKSGSFIRHNP